MTDPAALIPDVDTLVETVRDALFLSGTNGEARAAARAALSDLAATAREAQQAAVDYQRQSSEQADEAASWRTRAEAAEADRDRLQGQLKQALGVAGGWAVSDFSGSREIVLTRNVDALRKRLISCGVRYEFIRIGERTEVRFEDTPRARAYVAEYRLPPWDRP